MTPWLWIALVSNLLYWAVFTGLLVRRRWSSAGLVVGTVHMLLAGVFSVAPIRSFFDADYPGLAFGLLRFEGRSAVLPATIVLVWALSCAYLSVGRATGRRMWWVAAFDLLMAGNLAAGILQSGSGQQIQFGEHLTISGTTAVAIMLVLFALGPVASGVWSSRRARPAGYR